MTTTLLPDPRVPVPPAPPPPAATVSPRGRVGRFVRGREQDPRWVRPCLLALLVATAALYLWDLGASGWANSFYSAAVQAGTKSWKAFFFGSSDAANFITVDKPPASLWVMELSARIFGVNAWSILVPQALEGVAAVGVLYATVGGGSRRRPRCRRRGDGPHPRGRPHVPVQQPGRAAGAAAHARGVRLARALERGRTRLARPGASRSSASGSWRRCSRPSSWCRPSRSRTSSPGRPRWGAGSGSSWSRRGARGLRRLVGGDRRADPGVEPAPTSAARRTTASST